MNQAQYTTQPGQISSPTSPLPRGGVGGGRWRRFPRRRSNHLGTYDPLNQFVAAYTMQAVLDYIKPPKNLPGHHLQTACEFVHSPEGRDLIAYTGRLPQSLVRRALESHLPEWEVQP
ncbi:MAG: hypothetical protein BroJett011_04430 [Chloroflexota bacterium]|nr:MAG: hypothetical protein BroJett011_04430 [Chloroflexota bacterium]